MRTELDIVNAMLRATGERKHNTLNTQHPSVLTARDLISINNAEFQARGWWFNRNQNVVLIPDAEGIINVPNNHLSFTLVQSALYSGTTNKTRYVVRDNKVYDSLNNTFNIKERITANIIVRMNIEDMPALASIYLQHKCVEDFVVDDDGDIKKSDKYSERRQIAWVNLKVEELKATGVNSFDRIAVQQMDYRIGQGVSYNPRYPGGR